MPARSAVWKVQWAKVEDFRRKQYLLPAAGSYALTCPMIEDRFPGVDGKLRLDLSFGSETKHDGILI